MASVASCEVDGGQSTRAVSRQRTWWHQGDLGGSLWLLRGAAPVLASTVLPMSAPLPWLCTEDSDSHRDAEHWMRTKYFP